MPCPKHLIVALRASIRKTEWGGINDLPKFGMDFATWTVQLINLFLFSRTFPWSPSMKVIIVKKNWRPCKLGKSYNIVPKSVLGIDDGTLWYRIGGTVKSSKNLEIFGPKIISDVAWMVSISLRYLSSNFESVQSSQISSFFTRGEKTKGASSSFDVQKMCPRCKPDINRRLQLSCKKYRQTNGDQLMLTVMHY